MSDEVAGVGRPLLHPVPSWEEEIRTQTGAEGRRWVRSRQGYGPRGWLMRRETAEPRGRVLQASLGVGAEGQGGRAQQG